MYKQYTKPLAQRSYGDIVSTACSIRFGRGPAITEFDAALREVATGRLLSSGDLLIADNHRMVHGRTAFIPGRSSAERHLRRSYAAETYDGMLP
jgi:hypothetical protein